MRGTMPVSSVQTNGDLPLKETTKPLAPLMVDHHDNGDATKDDKKKKQNTPAPLTPAQISTLARRTTPTMSNVSKRNTKDGSFSSSPRRPHGEAIRNKESLKRSQQSLRGTPNLSPSRVHPGTSSAQLIQNRLGQPISTGKMKGEMSIKYDFTPFSGFVWDQAGFFSESTRVQGNAVTVLSGLKHKSTGPSSLRWNFEELANMTKEELLASYVFHDSLRLLRPYIALELHRFRKKRARRALEQRRRAAIPMLPSSNGLQMLTLTNNNPTSSSTSMQNKTMFMHPPKQRMRSTSARVVQKVPKAPEKTICGLKNYGQTCFLNSVLQALACLPPFLACLERIVELQHQQNDLLQMELERTPNDRVTLSDLLRNTLLSINNNGSKKKPMDPREILYQVGKQHEQFRPRHGGRSHVGTEQQDAQELLQALVGMVISETELIFSSTSNLQPAGSLEASAISISSVSAAAGLEICDLGSSMNSSMYSSAASWMEDTDSVIDDDDSIEWGDQSVVSLSSFLHQVDKVQKQLIEEKLLDTPPSNQVVQVSLNQAGIDRQCLDGVNDVGVKQISILDEAGSTSLPSTLREEKKQEDHEVRPHQEIEQVKTGELDNPATNGVHINDDFKSKRKEGKRLGESATDLFFDALEPPLPQSNPIKSESTSVGSCDETQQEQVLQTMFKTLSPTTPSPLSGWMGSTLQCCSCKHVRPIQNAPFLDIPIVPTAISYYLAGSSTRALTCPSSSQMPPCTLSQCLNEFTCVERVSDVECRSCGIQRALRNMEEEIAMLQGAIKSVGHRRKKKGLTAINGDGDNASHLRDDLIAIKAKYAQLLLMDADADDDENEINDDDALDLCLLDDESARVKAVRGNASKCLMLTRLPSILCLHVQRRYYDPVTNRMAKTMQHIDFPEILDMSAHSAYGYNGKNDAGHASWAGNSEMVKSSTDANNRNRVPIPYRLMSIIEHRGNAHAGHYQTYRRVLSPGEKGKEWAFVSDENVSYVEWEDVRKCQAYMLFYEAV
mmetsp:Transcript_14289/g.25952  ORF Transcript_14289/g.25952 Transcript_14289/m.25952 type:complete len:1010 (-) Transcript_14289:1849-4878(-)